MKSSKGIKLLKEFSGNDSVKRVFFDPPVHDTLIGIGYLDALMYTAHEGDVENKYIHDFNKSGRPVLAVSDDGKQLYILAGEYKFTARGIENG